MPRSHPGCGIAFWVSTRLKPSVSSAVNVKASFVTCTHDGRSLVRGGGGRRAVQMAAQAVGIAARGSGDQRCLTPQALAMAWGWAFRILVDHLGKEV
eukprot:1883882-Prymnesium_polylepis.1